MPIYEFQCEPCRTVFSFFSRRVDTTTCPPCPRCGRPLSREVSAVAFLQGGGDGGEDGLGDVRLDESRMEKAMEAMGDEIDKVGDSDDPKAAAAAMESFSKASGLTFNKDIRDAVHRMAAGEDQLLIDGEDTEALVFVIFARDDVSLGGFAGGLAHDYLKGEGIGALVGNGNIVAGSQAYVLGELARGVRLGGRLRRDDAEPGDVLPEQCHFALL